VNFKFGDVVQFNPGYFPGTREELLKRHGTFKIISLQYSDTTLHQYPFPSRSPNYFERNTEPHLHNNFINVQSKKYGRYYSEFTDFLCLTHVSIYDELEYILEI